MARVILLDAIMIHRTMARVYIRTIEEAQYIHMSRHSLLVKRNQNPENQPALYKLLKCSRTLNWFDRIHSILNDIKWNTQKIL